MNKTPSESVISYTGFLVEQRPNAGFRFMVFVAPAKEIVGWARADQISIDRGSVQRNIVASRATQIAKFFRANENNIIPTNVTIAFEDALEQVGSLADVTAGKTGYLLTDVGHGLHRITFPADVAERQASFIIDGQHRLNGMAQPDFEVRVPVSLMLALPRIERAFQFITINNKSHKVPTDNIK